MVYIQHGGGEDHRGWMEQGRTAQIMDNLIAAGKARPMVVVNSNSNVRSRNGGFGGGYEKLQGAERPQGACDVWVVDMNGRCGASRCTSLHSICSNNMNQRIIIP